MENDSRKTPYTAKSGELEVEREFYEFYRKQCRDEYDTEDPYVVGCNA